ncbi:hypothetical protein WM16_31710 [Burkholderia ubonensis]|uniref:Uncharacterized protein n=1 Tax=Burkholderia ubonensis TaxID=101571 RepID=A0A125JWY6_9BURK|nr:hypothetical protein [Burkholderia ubonensis]KWK83891.1 hypothetical protein WM16_31710 [Burkholderia ubonensis]
MPDGDEMTGQHIDLGKISGKLGGKCGVWVNQRYEIGGEPATGECFIKKTDGRFNVGFDDYLDKYEDAVDLYFVYLRAEFSELSRAVEFVVREGFASIDDLTR